MGDHVVVLHLHEIADPTGTLIATQPEDDRSLADIVAHTLRQAGVSATSLVRTSTASTLVTTIAAIAEEQHADVVLVGGEPTWISTHERPLAELTRLLPGVRVVAVR
jgi:hypothetical protein